MASSQVEIASSSPFSYVLNRNVLQKNLKDLVLHSCMSNSQNHADLWVHKTEYDKNDNDNDHIKKKKTKGSEKWDKARNLVFSMDKENNNKEEDGNSVDVQNLGGVSSLVRKWKGFEAESKSAATTNNNNNSLCVADQSPPQKGNDECDVVPCIVKSESFCDLKTESDITESERLRVADIIKKLSSSSSSSNLGDESPGRDNNVVVVNGGSLPRVRTSSDNNAEQQQQQRCGFSPVLNSPRVRTSSDNNAEQQQQQQQQQQRCGFSPVLNPPRFLRGNNDAEQQQQQLRCGFSPVLNSPRFIRGRQAFSDLLLQMERDRHRELEGLVERKAVSKFQQKGRIQALLRVILIRRGAEAKDDRSVNSPSSESKRLKHSAIMHLREKFNTGQLGIADSRITSKVVADSAHDSRSLPSTPRQRGEENCGQELKGSTSPPRKLRYSDSMKLGNGLSSYRLRGDDPCPGLVKEISALKHGVAVLRSTSISLGGNNARDHITCNEENNHQKPKSPNQKVVDNYPNDANICASNHPQQENRQEEVREQTSPKNVTTSTQVGKGVSTHQQREGDRQDEVVRERSRMQSGVVDSTSAPTVKGENTQDTCKAEEVNRKKPGNPINIPEVGKFCTAKQLLEGNDYKELSEQTSPNATTTEKEMEFRSTNSVGSCRSNQNGADQDIHEVHNLPRCTSEAQISDIFPEQASWGMISSEASLGNLLDFVESARPPKYGDANKQSPGTCTEWSSYSTNPQSDWEEEAANQQLVESDSGWVIDYSHTASGWDELHSNYEQQVEGDEDWISSISRPREEWEGLRQERYQEMLDRFLDNHDLQQLLLRKNVSNFLTSGLREKIDRIMASRVQQLPKARSRDVEEEEEEPAEVAEEVASQQNARVDEVDVEEEEGDSGYDNDSEDDNHPGRQLYNEPEILLIDQNTSSQTSQPWSLIQDQEVTDDSFRSPSTSSLHSQSSNIYYQQTQPCSSSARHPSTEMKLIYELRGHMEQLHQEIYEIRRSMKSCMNMQMKLQRSIKEDVAAAISQLGHKSLKNNSDNKSSNKGNCCVCYEVPVDSLLYRCGHMCTCFKCAHELLEGTGKCPICRAPILDVVRAYAHS